MLTSSRGFTLIELVIVIVITGILAVVVGPLIGRGYSSVFQSSERASWVQQAEYAFFHLRQDLSQSVPNSVRTPINNSDTQAVEFLGFSQTGATPRLRYRQQALSGFDQLTTGGDNAFDVFADLGNLQLPARVSIAGGSAAQVLGDWQANASSGSLAVISSYNVHSDNPADFNCDCGACADCPVTTLNLNNAAHTFTDHSPFYRAYLSDGPVAYQCSGGFLWRHSGYSSVSNSDLSDRLSLAGNAVTSARVIDSVQSCRFDWQPGTVMQPPSLTVTLSIGNARENIRLIDTIILAGAL